MRNPGSIPGLGRSPGEGNGNPLQYSCLENSTDRRAWWATVHGVAKSQTRLKQLTFSLSEGSESRPEVRVEGETSAVDLDDIEAAESHKFCPLGLIGLKLQCSIFAIG